MSKSALLVTALLNWFAEHGRDLPWRRNPDPYAIWISEIMLQQTQVKTVIPYWQRWMVRFPTLAHLAQADLGEALKYWEGLGYYRRAQNVQRAAQLILQERRGVFPRDFESVLALPGVGRYTAGAICSIAFNQPTPILDGNVIRVLTRIFGIGADPRQKMTNRKLWRRAEALVQEAAVIGRNPEQCACSSLNQALMDLGAMVCLPRHPNCGACPIRGYCVARRQNRVGKYPNLTCHARLSRRKFVAFVVNHGNRFLVRQRPAGVVNGRLWEFPNVEVTTEKPAMRPAPTARMCLGFVPESTERLTTIKHTITRYRITLEVFAAQLRQRPEAVKGVWRTLEELDQLAFPSAHRRILTQLRDPTPSVAGRRNERLGGSETKPSTGPAPRYNAEPGSINQETPVALHGKARLLGLLGNGLPAALG